MDGVDGSNDVLQAGTSALVTHYVGHPTINDHIFWVEEYPETAIEENKPVVNPGDKVLVSVQYLGKLPNYSLPQASAFLENITTGQYSTVYFNVPSYIGSSAEAVYELHGNYPLSGVTVNFKACSATWNTAVSSYKSALLDKLIYRKCNVYRDDTGASVGNVSNILNGRFTVTSN